jgi:hypothetical protein
MGWNGVGKRCRDEGRFSAVQYEVSTKSLPRTLVGSARCSKHYEMMLVGAHGR